MPDWIGREPTPDSPYYPYIKVTAGNTMAKVEELPYRMVKYLMDLPLRGYTPPSDNSYPRARLKKLMYWDGAKPLEQPLPTATQMKTIFYDPLHPGDPPDSERGYRFFAQELVSQSQFTSQSILRIYLGSAHRVQMKNTFVFRQTVITTIMCSAGIEANMQTLGNSRSAAIMQAVLEATEGVNFGGIGALNTSEITKFDDERHNTGYKIYQHVDWTGDDAAAFYE